MNDVARNGFDFSVPAASTLAAPVDALFFTLLLACGLVCLAVLVTLVVFCIRYRRGQPRARHAPPSENRRLETLWIAAPLVAFFGVFCWAAVLYARIFSPPSNAIDIFVIGKQWMWRVQHASGRQEIDVVHVPLGVPVRLVMSSQDVIHSFSVPAFRLKQDVLPGRYTALWFEATQTGVFPMYCTEYCGTDHARMHGTIVVMSAERYQQWLAGAPE